MIKSRAAGDTDRLYLIRLNQHKHYNTNHYDIDEDILASRTPPTLIAARKRASFGPEMITAHQSLLQQQLVNVATPVAMSRNNLRTPSKPRNYVTRSKSLYAQYHLY
jgi:hypothetical protein